MSDQVSEEVEAGAFPDEDEVRGAISEVSGGREALRTAGTRAAHTGRIDGNKLSADHTPTNSPI